MLRHCPWRRALIALAAALVAAPGAENAAAYADMPYAPSGQARQRPETPSKARIALSAARSRIGSPYAMGATGPSAFDCSGLTTYAMRRAGIALPRMSFDQFNAGTAVARGEIRAGDLVFFSTAGPGASHVGIATGRGTVISATSSGGVMEHSMSDAYWGGSYVGARRVS